MKQVLKLMVAASLLIPCVAASGQNSVGAKFEFAASGKTELVTPSMLRTTNFNPSVCLDDNRLTFVLDSLRTDGIATIVTVYETDADDVVGLWQIGSGSNRTLWLNSQSVSYDDFAIKYRTSTEKGVVIHIMTYQYPAADKNYNGSDTLTLGLEGDNKGVKNLCELLYFPGIMPGDAQRKIETALAVRYGALLHGSYVDPQMRTLWNTTDADSAYSHGVCAIGRDDSHKLLQTKSVIRGDILTLESSSSLVDLDYVFLGSDSNSLSLTGGFMVFEDNLYNSFARRWKMRARTGSERISVNLSADLDLPASGIRLLVTGDDGSEWLVACDDLSPVFKNVELRSGIDYYLTLLVDNETATYAQNDLVSDAANNNGSAAFGNGSVRVSPNPTTGLYTVGVEQSDEDIVDIRIMDVNGRIVEQFSTSEKVSQYTYTGSLQTEGVYYVTVTSNGRQKTIKLIVVK